MKASSLAQLLHTFFSDWMGEQLGLSQNTIRSYRDTWRLFLPYAADQKKKSVAKLDLVDLDSQVILRFLGYCEHERKSTIGTRNCRLAALRSFFKFVARREPILLAQCSDALTIPTKKSSTAAVCYMDREEIAAILGESTKGREGQRDHALISFLYNTGARIQEALDVCPSAIRFSRPHSVRLIGKGQKERFCPLWPETVNLLKKLLEQRPCPDDKPLFVNRYGQPLKAAGFRGKLDKYVVRASEKIPSLKTKRITPHIFRHSVGVHLVRAGVDLTVIRSWLGHVSLTTTNHYARADLDTKRDALALVNEIDSSAPPRWKKDGGLLDWLDSL